MMRWCSLIRLASVWRFMSPPSPGPPAAIRRHRPYPAAATACRRPTRSSGPWHRRVDPSGAAARHAGRPDGVEGCSAGPINRPCRVEQREVGEAAAGDQAVPGVPSRVWNNPGWPDNGRQAPRTRTMTAVIIRYPMCGSRRSGRTGVRPVGAHQNRADPRTVSQPRSCAS